MELITDGKRRQQQQAPSSSAGGEEINLMGACRHLSAVVAVLGMRAAFLCVQERLDPFVAWSY